MAITLLNVCASAFTVLVFIVGKKKKSEHVCVCFMHFVCVHACNKCVCACVQQVCVCMRVFFFCTLLLFEGYALLPFLLPFFIYCV